jgi:hypothetical protein
MTRTVRGIVHGRTIEVIQDLGVADGQQVEVVVKVIPSKNQWGDGLRRCAGALAGEWTDEDDRILAEIHQDRKQDTRREIAE